MKVKLDENLGHSIVVLFEAAGHDTSTIRRQHLQGATDNQVFDVCKAEGRLLVTLDLDFANPLVFDPLATAGVAVLRLPKSHGPSDLRAVVNRLLESLAEHAITGSLWVVRLDRVRVWQPRSEEMGAAHDGPT